MDWNSADSQPSMVKTYEIKQVDEAGQEVAEPLRVEAQSGESAVKQLGDVSDRTHSIKVCLDGVVMNEMDVDYWQKRIRRR